MTWTIDERAVIVTGGNSGIGRATAIALARAGADVTITARDDDRGADAARAISEEAGREVGYGILELTDRDSIRSFVDGYLAGRDRLGVLVNNAGGIFGSRTLTADGVETTWATNHLGPFLLTHLLTDALIADAPSRVIDVASSGHGFARDGIPFDDLSYDSGYSMREAYGASKLANILHAREFDRRYGDRGVHAYAVHPGLVRTAIGRGGDSFIAAAAWFLSRWRQLPPQEGADTIVWLATTPDAPEPTGGYFERRAEARSTRWARDDDHAARLWSVSEQLLGVAHPDPGADR